MLKTLEDALQFVIDYKICTIFGSKGSPYPSLWDNTDLSEMKPSAGGWSPRVMAVWDWKTRLPQTYPDLIFYGKTKGGDAVLMEMQYFRDIYYPASHLPIERLDELSQQIYELIRLEPRFTGDLRKQALDSLSCTKSQFETALKRLQISLNIVRSNDPSLKNDFWLTMREAHFDIVSSADDKSKE